MDLGQVGNLLMKAGSLDEMEQKMGVSSASVTLHFYGKFYCVCVFQVAYVCANRWVLGSKKHKDC